jgi:type IV secretion system protein VirB11
LQDGVPDNERGGYRVMIVRPPVVQAQTMAMCIRKPALLELTLDDYERQGAFDRVNEPVVEEFSDDHLRELYRARQWKEFLRAAVLAGKRIMVSAGTNAGKTTLLNTLLSLVPESARIVTMEDAREIRVRQPNVVNMVFSRGNQGLARVTANELLETMMRLTPDVAVAGELRGAEAAPYLELLNSGHGCSISTIHADSPGLMFERLALMVMRAGSTLSRQQIIEYARSLIQVVVQFKRGNDGRRYITEMLYEGA